MFKTRLVLLFVLYIAFLAIFWELWTKQVTGDRTSRDLGACRCPEEVDGGPEERAVLGPRRVGRSVLPLTQRPGASLGS